MLDVFPVHGDARIERGEIERSRGYDCTTSTQHALAVDPVVWFVSACFECGLRSVQSLIILSYNRFV